MRNHARFRGFIEGMTELVGAARADEPTVLDEGERLLRDLLVHDDWLPDPLAVASDESHRMYLLHCDPRERFSVMSFVWQPGQRTPVHDHTVWGLIGVLRGEETCEEFARPPLRRTGTHPVRPGDVDRVSPRIGDIHRVSNAGTRTSLSIHAYGGNIGTLHRHQFDPDSGAAADFVSGYHEHRTPLVAYDDRGPRSDTAFLVLPGWCTDRSFAAPLVERLAARHRVLSLDWRGHGDSFPPPGDFGHAELLEDALAVIEASGVRTVIPIGQAHGAWIAIELRRRLRARVPAIVATSWLVLDPPPPFLAGLAAMQDETRWKAARDQLFATWTAGAPAAIAARVHDVMGAYGFAMWARAGEAIGSEYARYGTPLRALAALDPPPRVLHVFSQPRAPDYLAAQESFAREHPWFAVHRLDGVSHFPPLELPDATAAAIETNMKWMQTI